MTTDDESPKEEYILKTNKSHINVTHSQFDYRITACIEETCQIEDQDYPVTYREKDGITYKFNFFCVDFSIVNTASVPQNPHLANRSLKDVNIQDCEDFTESKEIEFEFDGLETFLASFIANSSRT